MAGIRRLPSGKWQASVRLPDGKRITKTDPLKGIVQTWAKERELELSRGEIRDPRARRVSVVEWVDRWSAARVVRPGTVVRDSYGLRRIRAHWRGHLLGGVSRIEVQAWVQGMVAEGVGPEAIRNTFNLFAAAMKAATLESPPLIAATPCIKIRLPQQVPKLPAWFEHADVVRILDELPEPHRSMVELMVWCGLRWGEAAGLRLVDVDWLRRRIQIVGAMENRIGWKEYPKSAKSRRELPVPAWILDDLSAYIAEHRKVTDRSDPELLFLSSRIGAVLELSAWRKGWNAALERAGVKYRPPHTCRHTAASWLVQDGVPLYHVQEFMGHESYATTQRYAHLAPDSHDRIEASWANRPPVPKGSRQLVTHE